MRHLLLSLFLLTLCACQTCPRVGVVQSHSHREAYSYTTYILVGKVMVPQVRYVPEEWTLNIVDGDTSCSCSVSEARWNATNIGDTITTER